MVGKKLTELREAAGLTQKQLAKMVHISRDTYAQYEINRRSPDYETLQKLADYFRVSIDFLLGRTDDPTPPNTSAFRSPQEARLIENYRKSDDSGRKLIVDVSEHVSIKDDEQAASKG